MAIKIEKSSGFSLSALSEREKRLLGAMLAVFAVILVIIPIILFQRSMDDIDRDTRAYKQALDLIAVGGPEFLERKKNDSAQKSHKKLDEDVLNNNPVKLTSFVAKHAEATKITVSSFHSVPQNRMRDPSSSKSSSAWKSAKLI